MLQLDKPLVEAFHPAGFKVGVETNGTIAIYLLLDWICVSPKENTTIRQRSGHELKIVYPQGNMDPAEWEGLDFDYSYLSPLDIADTTDIRTCIEYCKDHPHWRLSLQIHKMPHIK